MITSAVWSVRIPRIGLSRCLSWLWVVGLDRIVGVSFDVVPGRRDELLEHGRVDRGGVGDYFDRDHLQRGRRAPEESAGRGGVSPG
jgi:hypothetical protein